VQTDELFDQYEQTIKKAIAEYPNEEKLIRTLIEVGSDY